MPTSKKQRRKEAHRPPYAPACLAAWSLTDLELVFSSGNHVVLHPLSEVGEIDTVPRYSDHQRGVLLRMHLGIEQRFLVDRIELNVLDSIIIQRGTNQIRKIPHSGFFVLWFLVAT